MLNYIQTKLSRAATGGVGLFFALLCAGTPLLAQTPKANPDPGFYRGALLASFAAGMPIQTGGTLIDSEKEYNSALRSRAQAGMAQFALFPVAGRTAVNAGSGNAAPVVNFESRMSGMAEVNLDYGLTDHIGAGMTILSYSVDGRQQESFPIIGGESAFAVDLLGTETVMLAPRGYQLFKGTSVLGSLSWHILSRTKFDPYITVRAGVTRFSSNAHSGLNYQPLRFQERSITATGKTVGAGLGMNIFFRPTVGMRVELSGLNHQLNTDRFDRTLRSTHLLFGFLLNVEAIERNGGEL